MGLCSTGGTNGQVAVSPVPGCMGIRCICRLQDCMYGMQLRVLQDHTHSCRVVLRQEGVPEQQGCKLLHTFIGVHCLLCHL